MTGMRTASLTARMALPVSLTGVKLLPGAAVHGKQRDAAGLRDLPQHGSIQIGAIPAQPHFEGHRDRRRSRDRRFDEALGQGQIAHKRRPSIAARDTLGRAAHVDIDGTCTHGDSHAGSLRHPQRGATRDLDNVKSDPLALGAEARFFGALHELL